MPGRQGGERRVVRVVRDDGARHELVRARALADPVRHAVFRYVASSRGPVGVAELARHVGRHPNAVRVHLARLRDAGLLVEETEARTVRGRPRLQYRAAPGASGAAGVDDPYRRLAHLLLEVHRSSDGPRAVGRRVGAAAAGGLPAGVDPVEAIEAEVARQGFAPRRRDRDRAGREVELVLERCPFADVAAVDPQTVCDLHLGLAEGLAGALGGGVEVRGLFPRDPHRAGCRLRLRGA